MPRHALLAALLLLAPASAFAAGGDVRPRPGVPTVPLASVVAGEFDIDELTPLPVPEPSPRAVAYHRTGLWLWTFARFWDVAVPALVLVTGASAGFRNAARKVGRSWFGTVAVYVVLFLAVRYLADLPLRYYAGYVRQHEYGLSNQTLAKWFGDSLKRLGVEMVGGVCFGWVPFWLIRRSPRSWWAWLAGLWVPFAAFVALVAPVWIDPLFNHYGPVKNKALEAEILALVERAGVSGSRVFEVNKSVDTTTINAYVTGLFGTKRIVLWDTLLAKLDDREVLAVVGHETGHYVLNHVPRGLALSSLLVLAGLFWADRAGRRLVARFGRRFGFDSLADVAATPLLLVLIALSSVVLGPVGLAFSRYQEHEADRFALDLTRRNHSAARAFADLQLNNLSVPHHTLIESLWRSTHPSVAERIEFCNQYHPWEPAALSDAGGQ
jgi:Zn-dependent protease with chaperone function